ncbi:MAG: hypothetical protein IPJ69_02250 [Deltaproteobacteria bacterium]|nr:MAG: hypothetical protein IPJ69_02250 [Deltaproteobacteria bacterium]
MSYSIFNAKADLTYVIRALAPALLTASSSPTSQENGYLPQVLKAIEYFHEIQSYPHAGHKFDMYPSQNEVHLVDSTRDRYVLSHTMNGYPAELGFRGLDGNRVIVIPSHVGISDIYLTHSQVHQESGEAKISLHVPREFLHAPVGAPMHEFSFAEEGVRHSIRVVLNQVKSSGVLQAQLMINGALMDRPPAESIFIQLPHKSIEDFLEANEAEIIELKKFAENLAEKAESPEDLETLIRGIMTTFSDEANAPYPVSSAVITGFHLVFINPKYFHSEIVKDRIPYGATTEVSETYPSRSFVFIDPNFIPDAFAKGSFDSRIFRNGLLKNGVQAELTRKYSDKGMNTGLEMDKQYWSVHLKYLMKHSPQSLPEFLRVFEEDLRYSSYALGSLYEEVVRSLVSHDKTETYSFMLGKLVSLKKEGIRG